MSFITFYLAIAFSIYYNLKIHLKTLELLHAKLDVKSRQRLIKRRNKVNKKLNWVLLWPVLLSKEAYAEYKNKKQD